MQIITESGFQVYISGSEKLSEWYKQAQLVPETCQLYALGR